MNDPEELLRHGRPADPATNVLQTFQNAQQKRGPGSTAIIALTVGLAAALFLVWIFKTPEPGDSAQRSDASELAAEVADDWFYVVQADANRVLVQRGADMRLMEVARGDEIVPGSRFVEWSEQGIRLSDRGADPVPVLEINRRAASAVQAELAHYTSVIETGLQGLRIQPDVLSRLDALARFGELSALHLLEVIAESGSDQAAAAADLVQNIGGSAVIAKLIRRADDDTEKIRQHALRALGQSPSPQATAFLLSRAVGSDEEQAWACVKTLAGRSDATALRALSEIAGHESALPEVRDYAQGHLAVIHVEKTNAR